MSWSNTYIGIPYVPFGRDERGCDCWGLVRMVYQQECGIYLDGYDSKYTSVQEHKEISGLISAAIDAAEWLPIIDYKPLDLLGFRIGTMITHIGIHVENDLMLHAAIGAASRIERYSSGAWKPRLVGAYRHRERMNG